MRSRRILSVLAVAALGSSATAIANAAQHSDPASSSVPGDLKLVQVRESLLATHYWYQQTYHGVPVLDTYYARHVDKSGAETVTDGRAAIAGDLSVLPSVAASTASSKAVVAVTKALAGAQASKTQLAVLPGATPKLVWSVISDSANGEYRSIVDARTGAVLKNESMVKHADGTGQVYDPNPVVKLQNESLTDGSDADSAVPASAYSTVTLHNLDGSGKLNGTYANMSGVRKNKQAVSSTNSFVYTRSDDRFEQVVAYHAVDSVQAYIQSLGFSNVNNESQDLLPDTTTQDNSWYSPGKDTITFGTGGVDDAEDVEVIWHEYGHAVQDDQVPGFGSGHDAGSIGEGWGDYLALTMSQANSSDTATTPWACLMDWDSVSYTSTTPHCIRRADTNLTVNDQSGEIHHDGQIWSRALYDVNKGLGREKANKLIIEATFTYAPDTSFAGAANATVAAAQALYGATDAATVKAAFQARGIL